MSPTTLIASIWNAALVFVAAASFAYGSGTLGAYILTSMVVTGILAGAASSVAAAIVEAIPWLSALTGTIASGIYVLMRIDMWLT